MVQASAVVAYAAANAKIVMMPVKVQPIITERNRIAPPYDD
jgi:hypothetical protein